MFPWPRKHERAGDYSSSLRCAGHDVLDYHKTSEHGELPIPSSQVLSVFEEFGFLIWKKTKVLSQENKILAELRDTLIPKLISGEIKISDAESIVEKADI